MRERKGQVLVGFKCESALQQEIFSAAKGAPVSQFLRDAIIEKLQAMQMNVDPALAHPRSRAGKGGPKPKPKPKGKRGNKAGG